jgi:hypothetical protein
MGQGDAQPGCDQAEMIAAEGGAVVRVETLGDAEPPYRHHQIAQEAFGVLGQMEGGGHDIAGGVVDNGVEIGFPDINALFDNRPMEKVGAPKVAEVGVLEGFDALGRFWKVTVQALCCGVAIKGRSAGFATVPPPFLNQFPKQTFDSEHGVFFPQQDQCVLQQFRDLCPAAIFPDFVTQTGQSQVLVTPKPKAQRIGGKFFLASVRRVVNALGESA